MYDQMYFGNSSLLPNVNLVVRLIGGFDRHFVFNVESPNFEKQSYCVCKLHILWPKLTLKRFQSLSG